MKYLFILGLAGLVSGCAGGGKYADWQDESGEQQATVAAEREASENCRPEIGSPHYFRKALLVAGTTSVNDVARDLPGLHNLLSERLYQHLDTFGRFYLSAAHNARFSRADSGVQRHIHALGREYAAQFLVKLDVKELGIRYPWGRHQITASTDITPKTVRDVLITLDVYDARSGALFHSRSFESSVSGDVEGHSGESLYVSSAWFNTELGREVDGMLRAASAEVRQTLACVPFATEVLAKEEGQIHIGAGHLQGVRPGDMFRVYRRSQVVGTKGAVASEQAGAWIEVVTVFPEHSIAKAGEEGGYAQVRHGDVVRAW